MGTVRYIAEQRGMRECRVCHELLPLGAFPVSPASENGRERRCLRCKAAYGREHRPAPTADAERTCDWCGETKPIDAFPVTRGYVRRTCRLCVRAWERDRYHAKKARQQAA